jgi:hypothetical protein
MSLCEFILLFYAAFILIGVLFLYYDYLIFIEKDFGTFKNQKSVRISATEDCAQIRGFAWSSLPDGLGYFWYRNPPLVLVPKPCCIRDIEDDINKPYRKITFLGGVSWELYGFIKLNPSGEFAPCVLPNVEAQKEQGQARPIDEAKGGHLDSSRGNS